MAGILNLSSLCRCCHTDGDFKSVETLCWLKDLYKTYINMLDETFSLKLVSPLRSDSSLICDTCILRVCDAYQFRCQVINCEKKFDEYWRNELAFEPVSDEIKIEHNDIQCEHLKTEAKEDVKIDVNLEDDLSNTDPREYSPKIKEKSNEKVEEKHEVEKKMKRKQIKRKRNGGGRKDANGLTLRQRFEKSFEIMHCDVEGVTYTCKQCTDQFKNNDDMREHVKNKHSQYDCATCKKICHNIKTWSNHVKKHTEKKRNTCASCNEKFESSESFHYKCSICYTSFIHKSSLRAHIRKHLGTHKVVLCDICGKAFYDVSNMRAHKESVHERLKPYTCDTCGKTFGKKKYLKIHSIKHSGEPSPHICEFCGKHYASPDGLERHKLTHDKIYVCRYNRCKMSFDDKKLYLAHVRSHRKSFPTINCDICGREFTTRYSLNRHTAIHRGERPFACDACGKKFGQKKTMEKHKIRKHISGSSESFKEIIRKKYGCEYCEKIYSHRSGLRSHVKAKHGPNIQIDTVCVSKASGLNISDAR